MTPGSRHTDETRAKMSAAQRGKTRSPEARAKIGAARRGKALTQAHREAISKAVRRRLADPETRSRHGRLAALSRLTSDQRADYDLLKRNGYTRAEAFAALGVPLP